MKVVVIIEGGVVQNIIVDDENINVVVVDYDTDGADETELVKTHHGDMAFVMSGVSKEVNKEEADKFF
jgi:hypothetical protein